MIYRFIKSDSVTMSSAKSRPHSRQSGLTLVELLVALTISSVIAIAAISALIVSRQGFSAVDASSQLRDNARFATDLIQRLGVQAGFLDLKFASTSRLSGSAGTPLPNVGGVTNAIPSSSDPFNASTVRATGSAGYGSDILYLKNQTVETYPDSGTSDLTMINCAGIASDVVATGRDDQVIQSAIYVAVSKGELSLMCSTGPGVSQPIIRGVENFQVLYGTAGVIPNTAPGTPSTSLVADRYLRADQMTVTSGTAAQTNENWRRVRSLRIGMVLRGEQGSAQDTSTTYYPFGTAADSSTGAVGSAMSSSNDPGTVFTPAQDRRLRQVVTFTVHLRNEQAL